MRVPRLPWAPAFALLLSGCTATAMTLMQYGDNGDSVIPSRETLQGELKGRALEVGTVSLEPWPRTGPGTLKLPEAAYVRLLDDQLRKAYAVADLGKGSKPAYKVDAIIEVARFTDGGAFFPNPSLLQVTMRIVRPDGSKAMQGRFIARGNVLVVPASIGGVGYAAAVPWPGGAVRDLSLTVPAMADTLARVGLGLRDGLPLEAIEISAKDDVSVIQPAAVLRDSKLGMRPLSAAELRRIGGAELP